MPQFCWPEDEGDDLIPLARPRRQHFDESTPIKPWIVPQPYTATSTATAHVGQGDAFGDIKRIAEAKRAVEDSMPLSMPAFGSASAQLNSLLGMGIHVTKDLPGYQLPDDVCVPADFRREFNEWARGFFTPVNILKDGETMIVGDGTIYMNPRTYEALKATFGRFDNNMGFK